MTDSIFRQTFNYMNWARKIEGTPPETDKDKGVHRDGQWIEPQFAACHRRLGGLAEEGKHWERTLYLDTFTDSKGKQHLRLTVIRNRKEGKNEQRGRSVISRDLIFGSDNGSGYFKP